MKIRLFTSLLVKPFSFSVQPFRHDVLPAKWQAEGLPKPALGPLENTSYSFHNWLFSRSSELTKVSANGSAQRSLKKAVSSPWQRVRIHDKPKGMKMSSTVELRDLELPLQLGTYGPDDLVPEAHLMDLTLTIDPSLVMVKSDEMSEVFDYDPLIAAIDRLARERHYETQEFFMSRVIDACAEYSAIEEVDIFVSKRPVLGKTGQLGVRLRLDQEALRRLRADKKK